jgi:cell division protein FtsB
MAANEDRGGTQVGLRKKASLLFSVIVFIALVVGSLFGDGGILQLWEERARTEALEHEIQRLRVRNSELAEEIHALRSDPQAIERLAREELGLVRPGETVFLIREELSPDPR